MKKILSGIALISAVGLLVIGVSSAFFSDTETSKDNLLQAGKLDLKIDNESFYNGDPSPKTSWEPDDLPGHLFFNFQDLKPGDWGEDTISLRVDDNDAWACMNISLTEDDDETCNEPELEDDATCVEPDDDLADGELASNLQFVFWADDGDNVLEVDENRDEGVFKFGTTEEVFDGKIISLADALGGVLGLGGPFNGGKTYYIGKAWCFGNLTFNPVPDDQGVDPTVEDGIDCDGSNLDNATQTDKVLVDFEFSAYQRRHNDNFTCTGEQPSITPSGTVTPTPTPIACGKADVMLVLDRSGSIDDTEEALLKTAAKSFVDTLALTPTGNHAGKSSFATTASLNHHLTDNAASLKAAIDAMVTDGFTNLAGGIDLAKLELDNPGDLHDRADGTSPDKMVVITDGHPNRPLPSSTADDLAATSANNARAAGSEIFVVGVGVDATSETYLKTEIADDAGHYFSVADYSGLQTILDDIDLCE